jgi:leucyl aminopeptidase
MQIHIRRGHLARLRVPLLCVPLHEGERLQPDLVALDKSCGGAIGAVLRARDFRGKLGTQVTLYNTKPAGPRRIVLLGAGKQSELDLERMRQVAARAVVRAGELGVTAPALLFPAPREAGDAAMAQALAEGGVLGSYRYDKYRSESDDEPAPVRSLTLVAVRRLDAGAADGVRRAEVLADVVRKTRDMVNAPANELTPAAMAALARDAARAHGYRAKVLERADAEKLGMAGLLAVSAGSSQPPKFIVVEYDGAGPRAPRHVFVGKGITFDSGGICIKPAPKMDEMKGDMAGGAAVLGAVEAAARLRLPVRAVGLVPCTENLLGGSAYRPGDILRMANGKTVMVDNTDAEGRLILADALVYAQRYQPKAIVDLATLTGATLIALGQVASAVLGTDRGLIESLKAAGERCHERLWELPLWEDYEELIRSPIADIKNTGGKNGGTITAAAFLKHFVGTAPWAHLDIAGTSYLDRAEGYRPQGGTGVGVRLLVEYLRAETASAAPSAHAPRKR